MNAYIVSTNRVQGIGKKKFKFPMWGGGYAIRHASPPKSFCYI